MICKTFPLGVTSAGTDWIPAVSASPIRARSSPILTTSTFASPIRLIMSCSALTQTGQPA
ncbi:hypothetical protein KUH03_01085 [Sphingobacterium sp. E70]|uniref:hypothetical protein n=1 Tax=Sphingobacterium sp. E70 TaxID=2853439 RepID=UPI00211BC913|nr:hypothetical protein [Sphingobacterium sp. E70]ULT25637.1 hypothetical protein KUH03_01085 [Sphingobacterium sp. E70]